MDTPAMVSDHWLTDLVDGQNRWTANTREYTRDWRPKKSYDQGAAKRYRIRQRMYILACT